MNSILNPSPYAMPFFSHNARNWRIIRSAARQMRNRDKVRQWPPRTTRPVAQYMWPEHVAAVDYAAHPCHRRRTATPARDQRQSDRNSRHLGDYLPLPAHADGDRGPESSALARDRFSAYGGIGAVGITLQLGALRIVNLPRPAPCTTACISSMLPSRPFSASTVERCISCSLVSTKSLRSKPQMRGCT